MEYVQRVADQELKQCLAAAGAVLIEGPRACGKTMTARREAASEVFLDVDRTARDLIASQPDLLLEGAIPRLIDEWQTEPVIWNHVRRAVDARPGKGHFILTGSAVPLDDVTRHTGAGRILRVRLRPMSLFELGAKQRRRVAGEGAWGDSCTQSKDRAAREGAGRDDLRWRLAGAP